MRRADRNQDLAEDAAEDDHEHDSRDSQVHPAGVLVEHITEPCRLQIRLQDDSEHQHVEAPREDTGQHCGRELVLAGRTGEPGTDGAMADDPDGKDA